MPAALDPAERLIVALDFPSAAPALALVEQLQAGAGARRLWLKVGLELYAAAGPSIVEALAARDCSIFLDLKLHDIPNTVAGAVRAVSLLGASLLTVHAAGGPAMLEAAAGAVATTPRAPRLLAVTVLTSMDSAQLAATGVPEPPSEQVLRLARLAHASRIDGLVCSPEEAATLRAALPDSLLVVPGIRPAGSARGDQSRIATPATALAAGASMLVVGRPITRATDPVAAYQAILAEVSSAITPARA